MKHIIQYFLTGSLLCCLFFLSGSCVYAAGISLEQEEELLYSERIENLIHWERDHLGLEESDSFLSGKVLEYAGNSYMDWFVISMADCGLLDEPDLYLDALSDNIKKQINDGKTLSVTDYQRLSMVISACGGNPFDFDSINYIKKAFYGNMELLEAGQSGINGIIYGLISYERSKEYVPEEDCELAENFEDELCSHLISLQNEDGGFSLSGSSSDPDITAMALQALSYFGNEKIKKSSDRAWDCLKELQNENGEFASSGYENLESTAQVLLAMLSYDMDPSIQNEFAKNGNTLLDILLSYQNEDGGFAHVHSIKKQDGDLIKGKSDQIASSQAFLVLSEMESLNKNLEEEMTEEYILTDKADPGENLKPAETVIPTAEGNTTTEGDSETKTAQDLESKSPVNVVFIIILAGFLLLWYFQNRKMRKYSDGLFDHHSDHTSEKK